MSIRMAYTIRCRVVPIAKLFRYYMICNTGGYSGIDVGGKMKEIGFTHWSSPNSGATNSSGFTALPNGTIRPPAGSDVDLGKDADWWSSTEFISGYAWFIVTKYNVATAGMNHVEKDYGWGVRCVKIKYAQMHIVCSGIIIPNPNVFPHKQDG